MMHEIDDTDRKIIEIVISYDKNPQSDDGILGKMGEVIEMDELMDRQDYYRAGNRKPRQTNHREHSTRTTILKRLGSKTEEINRQPRHRLNIMLGAFHGLHFNL